MEPQTRRSLPLLIRWATFVNICLATALDQTGASVDGPNSSSASGSGGDPYSGTTGTIVPVKTPTFTKKFGVGTIPPSQNTTLMFTITNPSGNPTLNGFNFTDTLPDGLEVASSPAVTNTCGGLAAAQPGSNFILLKYNSTLPAGPSSCTIVVPIVAVTVGQKNNVTSQLTSFDAPSAGPATATIYVAPSDAVQVSYAANLKAGDPHVNLTNAGQQPPPSTCPPSGACTTGPTIARTIASAPTCMYSPTTNN